MKRIDVDSFFSAGAVAEGESDGAVETHSLANGAKVVDRRSVGEAVSCSR